MNRLFVAKLELIPQIVFIRFVANSILFVRIEEKIFHRFIESSDYSKSNRIITYES
jgi:hypothetical protein